MAITEAVDGGQLMMLTAVEGLTTKMKVRRFARVSIANWEDLAYAPDSHPSQRNVEFARGVVFAAAFLLHVLGDISEDEARKIAHLPHVSDDEIPL